MSFYNKKENTEINITPLIDVVFILLIFFMISTTFISVPGFRVNLPKTSAPSIKSNDKNLVITISRDNKIDINGNVSVINKLPELIKEQLKTLKDPLVILQSDKNTSNGFVVDVMDIIKESGLTKIAIATERKNEKNN
jgi:biopolymer transport protein ExbD